MKSFSLVVMFITSLLQAQEIKTGYELVSELQCVKQSHLSKYCDFVRNDNIKLVSNLLKKEIYLEINYGDLRILTIYRFTHYSNLLYIEIKPDDYSKGNDIYGIRIYNNLSTFDILFMNGLVYKCKTIN